MNNDWTFWIALVGAAIIRVLTSPFHSLVRAATQIVVSVFIAWLFTDAVVDYLHLNPTVYRAPMGGLLALTADGLIRLVLNQVTSAGKLSALTKSGKDE